jgi:hypothetical protein
MVRLPLWNSPPAGAAGHLVPPLSPVCCRVFPSHNVITFPPERLQGKPLLFRSFLGQDYVAEVDGLRVGWILQGTSADGGRVWWWTVTGPSCGMARLNNVGRSTQLEVAQEEVRICYTRWLDWALKQQKDVIWFGAKQAEAVDAPALDSVEG